LPYTNKEILNTDWSRFHHSRKVKSSSQPEDKDLPHSRESILPLYQFKGGKTVLDPLPQTISKTDNIETGKENTTLLDKQDSKH
jgi:hypothetical protein